MNMIVARRPLAAMFAAFLSACQPSGAQDVRRSPDPAEQDIASAYHPGYRALTGSRSECLGRLAFEVPSKPRFEWGLRRLPSNEDYPGLGFSRILQGGQDMMHLADVAVVVTSQAERSTIAQMQDIIDTSKSLAKHDFDREIKGANSLAQRYRESLLEAEAAKDQERAKSLREGIAEQTQEAETYKLRKQNLEKDWHPTDWGLPNSLGYIAGPTLYAFILRNGYAFQFMSTGGEGDPPFEERLAAFKSLLQRFEYRPLYQVPTKPGLCIPHGFIADDGQGHFSGEVSYRYADSPGVIYTLGTGVEDEQNFRANEPILEATARSTVAGLMGNAAGRKLKALGPKSVSIGARSGTMGGITTTEGKPGYSVYAGTSGWSHSKVLVPISLNMRSFDRETVPDEIKVDPPPFAQSLQRFELTLGSLRTRGTPAALGK